MEGKRQLSPMSSRGGRGARAVPGQRLERVLFISTRDSARSQMAKALLNALFDRYVAMSAGLRPGRIDPRAIVVMREIGIDISNSRSKSIEEMFDDYFDIVVTLCDAVKEDCPMYPGGNEFIHQGFEDPVAVHGSEEEQLNKFRQVRDRIRAWLEETF
jgi:arsenate reductase